MSPVFTTMSLLPWALRSKVRSISGVAVAAKAVTDRESASTSVSSREMIFFMMSPFAFDWMGERKRGGVPPPLFARSLISGILP